MIAGVGLKEVLIVVIKVVVAFVVMLIAVILMIWFERKVIAGFQNRIGPNKAGPWGIMQTLADGMKLVFKEYIHPERSDRFVFLLAPYLAVVPVFVVFAIVPVGGDFTNGHNGVVSIFGDDTLLQVADPPIGILLMLAMSAVAVYGVMLAGWSSGSKYPLLGSVRASAQMVSYEAALGLSIATVLVVSGTLSTNGIVVAQDGIRNWNIIATGVVPFVVFFIAVTAEMNRPPFDLTEAEQELVGGYQTEYSSMRFAMYYLAEFLATVVDVDHHHHPVPRRAPRPVRHPGHPERHRGHALAPRQAARLPLRLRLAAGHAAPVPLRPADGPRLEAAHPRRLRLDAADHGAEGGPGRGLEPRPGRGHRPRRGGGGVLGVPAWR